MIGACYIFALLSRKIVPNIAGVSIHQYAWLVVLMLFMASFSLKPKYMINAMNGIKKYINGLVRYISLFCMSICLIDLEAFIVAVNFQNFLITFLITLGGSLGAAMVGHFVGLFAVDSAICGGLCMANMGGSGDLMTLTAGKRMNMMAYAAISSRIPRCYYANHRSIVFGIFG